MIKGMTGYGSAELSMGRVKAIVEIKSLNHRYLDVNFYLPIGFGSVEEKIRKLVQKQMERGRVTIAIKITQKPLQKVKINKDIVKAHIKNTNQLKKEFKLEESLSLAEIISLPGVLSVSEVLVNPENVWNSLEKCLKKSLKGLINMRVREGKSLAIDLMDQQKRMLLQIKKIQARSKLILREKKKKVSLEEFKSFQKSNNISEEIIRFTHYVDELKLLVKSNVSVGKKIDFIAQEMQRETNTLGSKLQDKIVSNAVISLKNKIEKVREQAQNIE